MNRLACGLILASLPLVFRAAPGGDGPGPPPAESAREHPHGSQLPWDRLDTLAVSGGGATAEEPPFYRVYDGVLDNERNVLFLVNGGDGELVRYDIASGRMSRVGRGGSGPGEFWPQLVEPLGPDSLLVYDRGRARFSVVPRSGEPGRSFNLGRVGARGGQLVAMTVTGTRLWVAQSSGMPGGLMRVDTPPGTKARDTAAVFEMTLAGGVSNTVTRIPHAVWERTADTTSFEVVRDFHAAWATIAGGGERLFAATFGADSLEVVAYRLGGDAGALSGFPVELAGLSHRGLRQVYASRDGSLWVVGAADDSTVFHVFGESGDAWTRQGTLAFPGTARILDVSQDRVAFVHLDELDQEIVVVARAAGPSRSPGTPAAGEGGGSTRSLQPRPDRREANVRAALTLT